MALESHRTPASLAGDGMLVAGPRQPAATPISTNEPEDGMIPGEGGYFGAAAPASTSP
jgi:hypothetical protein